MPRPESFDAPITVFFDGLCPVCSREVRLYRRLHAPGAILWRDLASAEDLLQQESFGLADALALLHVRDADSTLRIGLAAHLCMWQRLPGFRVIVAVLRLFPALMAPLDAIYRYFTARRPGLTRRGVPRV